MPFYAWASVIVNGRVVATDYAPDVGWLDRSPDAKPLSKPGGTYVLDVLISWIHVRPVHLSMTVPDGWTDHGGPDLTRDGLAPGTSWSIRGNTKLQFQVVDNPENPCRNDRTPSGRASTIS